MQTGKDTAVSYTHLIDLNPGHTGHFTYKDDFTIDDDGVPICRLGLRMHKDGYEAAKHRAKYRCPKANRKRGCFCEHPCSPAKYGRTVHIFTEDNPSLFNIPPRDSKAWEKEYNRRTSVERSNKREKEDYKLEDGRHRSTKMWYLSLIHIFVFSIAGFVSLGSIILSVSFPSNRIHIKNVPKIGRASCRERV